MRLEQTRESGPWKKEKKNLNHVSIWVSSYGHQVRGPRPTFSSWKEQMCSWVHFMRVILSAVTVHACDPGSKQNKAGSVLITGHAPEPIQQGSVSLQRWERSSSVMALAAAAILLFVYQSACCSGRPPSRKQIALFTVGRRVMARMSDGNVFCCDRRGQERSITQL